MMKIRPRIWIAMAMCSSVLGCSTSTMLWNRYNQRFAIEGSATIASNPPSVLRLTGGFPGIPSAGQKILLQAPNQPACDATIIDALVHTGYASGIIQASCPFGVGLLRFRANLPQSNAIDEEIHGRIGEYQIELKITNKSLQ